MLWLMVSDSYPDPDLADFIIENQDAKKKIFKFFCLFLFEGTFTSFFKDKKSTNTAGKKASGGHGHGTQDPPW